jgi:Fur family zinc uptake transcriptional regulator
MTETVPKFSPSAQLACTQHDHQHCINTALNKAKQLCQDRKARLTDTREQVLKLIWGSHQPLGAYAIMDALREGSQKAIAPPTVYRALDFLLELGLVHRINSMNAYIGCLTPESKHHCYFLICRQCHIALEFEPSVVDQAIDGLVTSSGFIIENQSLELIGLCPQCQS